MTLAGLADRALTKRRAALILAAVCFAVYMNALGNGFVYDDEAQVVNNRWLRDPASISEIFTGSVWGFRGSENNYYRPLMHVIYMGVYQVFGLSPVAFHAVNVALHACVTVLVFLLTLRLAGGPGRDAPPAAPFMAALIFAVHPVHTEAVTWIAGLPDLSYGLFFLLSLYLYVLWSERGPGRSDRLYALSVAAFFLATLCKEPAVVLPLFVVATDHVCGRRPAGPGAMAARYGPYLLAAAAYLGLRANALAGFAPVRRHTELAAWQYVEGGFRLFAQYTAKLALPFNLNAFHVFHPAAAPGPAAAASVLLAALFAAAAALAYRRSGPAFIGLLLVIAPLLPTLYIPVLGENSFAERYLYLPSAGAALLIALAAGRASTGRAAAPVFAALLVVAALFSAGTLERNAVWKDDISLWSDTSAKSPDGALPNYNMGRVLMRSEDTLPRSVSYLKKAVEIDPGYAKAHVNLGVAYYMTGRVDESVAALERARELDPSFADTYYNLGVAYMAKGDYDRAAAELEQAIRLEPDGRGYRKALDKAYKKMKGGGG